MLTIAVIAAGVYSYAVLSAQIDARLTSGALDNAAEIYSAPLTISASDRLPDGTVINYLRATGYTERQPGDLPKSSRAFTASNGVIEIEPEAGSGFEPVGSRLAPTSG